MLPKETAHSHIVWHIFVDGHWVSEDLGDIGSNIRSVLKKRHKKKVRIRSKKLVRDVD